jgi:hypothetical protein
MSQAGDTLRTRIDNDGHQGALTDYLLEDAAFSANQYDRMLKYGCQAAGFAVAFASHDIRALGIMAALSNRSKSFFG